MARGSEGKSARKQARKDARAKEAERILEGDEDVNGFSESPSLDDVVNDSSGPNVEEDSSSSDDEDEAPAVVPEKTPEDEIKPEKKSKSKSARAKKKAAAATAAAQKKARGEDGGACCGPSGGGGAEQGIKKLPLIMLIMLTGTTVIPALLYMGDYFSAYIQKNNLMGNLGHRLGIGSSPKTRVISFYEKHDPEKLDEIPTILSKYYGDYPKLVKRLERKYGDYGYFINWEQDEAPMTLAFEKVWETQEMLQTQFDRHAPALVKTGARNMRHNFTFLYKKVKVVWKKQVWPVLEPHFGVPDAKTAKKQKLKDKKEAANRKKEQTGRRRKSAEFRDDDNDEM
eukprot:CAMPEP_0201870152 /NCGR_PEP_ID=MMETSP0902-20130614/3368_1 /ASSEMBLY_ACC=CAM_ASM_000551 /TAXON_ID=420261 /ORGANISM="Thalassiosira antarctica, Strain CCMP982" /LENGTH=340 /DNA_ID=CAMNT_0048395727 /DNA_START=38 /DNA_END=1060 /DNA_ORIENTATION=+